MLRHHARKAARQALTLITATVASIAAVGAASAQQFPSKAMTLVAPYGPGATLDMIARRVAEEMSKKLGQPIVVENRPGADGQVGMEYVANRVKPDGYTFMITSVPAMTLLPLTIKNMQFDPLKDFTPFIGIGEGRYMFGSASSNSWKTINELVAYAKAGKERLLYGASNPAARFWAVELTRALNLNATGVPYKDSGAYIQALGTGEVSMGFLSEISALSLGERFRVMATTGTKRSEAFPDAPTFNELGLPQMRGDVYALSVPKGTPHEIIDVLHKAASDALQTGEVQEALAKFKVEVLNLSPEEIGAKVQEQYQMFAKLAEQSGSKPQ